MLDGPRAREDEIAQFIIDRATDTAHDLFQDDAPAPVGDDLYSRAVRGVHATLTARREALAAAEQAKRYAETDEIMRRKRAGEDSE